MSKRNNLYICLVYSLRFLRREWKRFILPLVSLSFTAGIVLSVLLLTNSAGSYLIDKNKELVGADVSLETNYQVNPQILEEIVPQNLRTKQAEEFSFSTIIGHKDTNIPVSMLVVDEAYPIYGSILLQQGTFETPTESEIYIDQNTANKLGVQSGETIIFANKNYSVKGIIKRDPRQLLAGFGFLPKVILSQAGFKNSSLQKDFLRADYKALFLLEPNVTKTQKEQIVGLATKAAVEVEVVGLTRTGFIEGLSVVEQFLALTVLLVCVLAAVNMYAGVLYLIAILRKSFALLLALGLPRSKLTITISLTFLYTLILAMVLGSLLALGFTTVIFSQVSIRFGIELTRTSVASPFFLTAFVLFAVSIAAFVPSLRTLLALSPKELLQGQNTVSQKSIFKTIVTVTVATLLPLGIIAVVLLDDLVVGAISILVLTSVYVGLASIFYLIILWLYRRRLGKGFMLRSIIAFKKADGVFGIISLTSLYVALTALCVLILLQSSLTIFLKRDIGGRIPGLYIIDVQKSQAGTITDKYPQATLFPNVGARIVSIDAVDIQGGLARADESIDRELGREYNLTYRTDMLASEKVLSGTWLSGVTNEVSVDAEFAKRAKIQLGSRLVFSIQGFPIESTVTSLRQTDSRSGLPFFYFVFNTKDLEQYPATFFGYGYFDEPLKKEIISYLGKSFPNVSVIDTKEVSAFAEGIIGGLLILVFIISVPPLVLALFLIVTLVIAAYSDRRRVSAQLTALGTPAKFVSRMYYLETISATLISSLLAYLTGVIVTYIISIYYLRLPSWSYYNSELLLALSGIILLIIVVAYSMRRSDRRSVREILSHEE